MSICRLAKIGQTYGWNDECVHDASTASDVYMYEAQGFIACQECKLGGNQQHGEFSRPVVKLNGYEEARIHLLAHRVAGHAVPESAIETCKSNIPL